MLAEIAAIAVMILAIVAEMLHSMRVKRLAPLSFGPSRKPALWVAFTPIARVIGLGLLTWGFISLCKIDPKVYKAKAIEEGEIQHIVLILDVSPSMKLQDAGADRNLSRSKRAYDLMESFFKRVSVDQYRLSLVATYTSAKPVVVDTKDTDVVRNFLDGMDMYTAFESGQTQLFTGLDEAAKIAEPWKPKSTTIVLISDGDTVPATGMPKMPRSVKGVLVVGVGDSKTGTFIDGRQSKQDVSALRQIALRLGGVYHDGNEKHLPTETLMELTKVENESPFDKLSKREYALAAVTLGGLTLAGLPILLLLSGTVWRPGVR
jgi:Ca-activated chloride channel family protein